MAQTLYILVGLPGSGKSTYAAEDQLYHESNTTIVCPDAIRGELYGDESIQGNPREVFTLAYKRLHDALAAGKNVVFDATNLRLRARKQLYRIAEGFDGVSVALIVFQIPFEECCKRNESRDRVVPQMVMNRMHSHYDEPSFEESDLIDMIRYIN